MGGLGVKRFQRGRKLFVTICSDVNENAPVIRDWERFDHLMNHLVEVDRDCIVVVAKSGSHHMQHLFASEDDGTT